MPRLLSYLPYRRVVMAAMLSMLMTLVISNGLAQESSAPKPAFTLSGPKPAPTASDPKPAPTVANPAKPESDRGWPRTYPLPNNGGSVTVYQPQIASWKEQKHIVFWAAVAYAAPGATQAVLGTVKAEADTEISVEEKLVKFTPLQVTQFNFQSLTRDQGRTFVTAFQQAIPSKNMVISLDRVLAGVNKSEILIEDTKKAVDIKADPPKIYSSTRPAILALFEGEPILSPVESLDLKYAVNTNWDIFQQVSTSVWFLRNDKTWLKATDINGPWTPAGKLPADFGKLPDDANWKDVKDHYPGQTLSEKDAPTVFVSITPAEMILLKGKPKLEAVSGTKELFWVSNTESDLFREGKEGLFYYLVAGRWFSAASLDGPWTFATLNLPADFRKIPLSHPRSRILASIPGTEQASEAILMAQVPQTAQVNIKEIQAPTVIYDGGTPVFQPIPNTKLYRAVNTDKDVIQDGTDFYLCYQAVWFVSKSPTGPWEVARSVPPEVYKIPPSSPAYNVTYVNQQGSATSDYVETSYTAGYVGMMVAFGCCVWGSGYYYPPYYRYPCYYPYPATYGAGAWYNPHTGAYGRGFAAYGPYGGISAGASYNPRTGTYARGGAAYGPYGSSAYARAYNPRTGASAATRQGANIYGNWGSTVAHRGDSWAQTGHVTDYRTGQTTSGIRTSEGGAGIRTTGPGGTGGVARTAGGDVYAGRDGNVYRNTGGSWQKYENGSWSPTAQPKGTPSQTVGQLNKDQAARVNGTQRANTTSNYNASGGNRNTAGSYQPRPATGGGGRMGGGGGRRR